MFSKYAFLALILISPFAQAAPFKCEVECTFYAKRTFPVLGHGTSEYSAEADARSQCTGASAYQGGSCVQTPEGNYRCSGVCAEENTTTETIRFDSESAGAQGSGDWYCHMAASQSQRKLVKFGQTYCGASR
jgi:hypothetical protein